MAWRPLLQRARANLPVASGALLVGVALYALVFQLTLPGRLPSEADYRSAAEHLAREAHPGDAVLLFPWWAERARLFVPEGIAVVGYLGSEGAALERHPRVWLLSLPGAPRADRGAFEAAFLPGRVQVGTPQRFGGLTLALHHNGRHRPLLFSATEQLAKAKVYLQKGDGTRLACPFDGTAHQCPKAGVTVAAEWHELKFVPRRCLRMFPPGGSDRLVVEYPAVPRGDLVRLEAGIVWEHAVRTDARITKTRIGVERSDLGEHLGEIALPPGLEGMQQQPLALPAQGAAVPLRIWLNAENPEAREACVELTALGPTEERS